MAGSVFGAPKMIIIIKKKFQIETTSQSLKVALQISGQTVLITHFQKIFPLALQIDLETVFIWE